tara:strand:- start:419 stop:655 length:237 start_codon:yes stop_codon:yes gene_type:complete
VYIGRRQVLKGIGATLGALSLRGYVLAKEAAAHFTHGVASGDPLVIGLLFGRVFSLVMVQKGLLVADGRLLSSVVSRN